MREAAARSGSTAVGSILASRVGRQLLWLLMGSALLPLAGFAWLSNRQVSTQLQEDAERGLHVSVKAVGMALAERLLRVRTDFEIAQSELLGRGPDALRLAPAPVRDRLIAQFRSIQIQEGQTIRAEIGTPSLGLVVFTADERKHLDRGKTLVRAATSGDPMRGFDLMFASRMPWRGELSCVLIGEVDGASLWDSEGMMASGAEVFVMDAEYRWLFLTTDELPDGELLAEALGLDASAGTVHWQVAGEAHMARYWRLFLRPQYGVDWIIVQSRATSRVLAPLFGFQRGFALIAVLSLLVVVLAGTMQIRRTLRPILELRDATHRVAAGDFAARVGSFGNDEFGDLGRSFNHMTAQLVENIERRTQTEQELMAARDAALEAGRAKAEFLTNVSHELRTPLTSILSSSEILRSYPDEDPEVRAEFLEQIVTQSQHLTEMIEKVLQLSGHGPFERQAVDPVETLCAAVEVMEPGGPHGSGRIRLELADRLPLIEGAHDRLVQLWLHLVDNALKFSPESAPVVVRARHGEGELVVEVVDQGGGIAEEDLAHVFEPFRQVGRDILTEKAPGTGLGLTLARNIVERHGGRIEVETAVGRGSTFRVHLPVGAPVGGPKVCALSAP